VLEIAGNDFLQSGTDFLLYPYGFGPGTTRFGNIKNNYLKGLNYATNNEKAPVKMVLANLPDLSSYPILSGLTSQEAANLQTWEIAWNNTVLLAALQHSYAVLDLWSWWNNVHAAGGFSVDGIWVPDTTWNGQGGLAGMDAFFLDGLHPTPIGQALLLNQVISTVDAQWNAGITQLTDVQMVTLTGLVPSAGAPVARPGTPAASLSTLSSGPEFLSSTIRIPSARELMAFPVEARSHERWTRPTPEDGVANVHQARDGVAHQESPPMARPEAILTLDDLFVSLDARL
jgi:hypothetical protein